MQFAQLGSVRFEYPIGRLEWQVVENIRHQSKSQSDRLGQHQACVQLLQRHVSERQPGPSRVLLREDDCFVGFAHVQGAS